MSVPLRLEGGDAGEALRVEGEVLAIVSPRAFAPGAPVRMEIDAGDEPVSVEGKTIGSKRRDDGRFDVRLRLINLRRAHRDALRAALPG